VRDGYAQAAGPFRRLICPTPLSRGRIMATSKTINLPNIQQGSYMAWNMATQAGFNICVTLKDSTTTYVNNQCRQNTAYGILSQGSQQVAGTGLQLTINIASSDTMLTVVNSYSVTNPNNGNNVGQGYNVLVEDSSDNDFNDLFVNIIAWQSQG
jgi:hypothetical protein